MTNNNQSINQPTNQPTNQSVLQVVSHQPPLDPHDARGSAGVRHRVHRQDLRAIGRHDHAAILPWRCSHEDVEDADTAADCIQPHSR